MSCTMFGIPMNVISGQKNGILLMPAEPILERRLEVSPEEADAQHELRYGAQLTCTACKDLVLLLR